MKNFIFKALDIIGAGTIWVGGIIVAVCAIIAGAVGLALSIVCSLAVPALCVVAIWGILKYFGVI